MDATGRSSMILLVEDNPDDVHLARLELEDAGVRNELTLLEDGEAALRYLRQQDPYLGAPVPGLVLLDLHLPRVDGHEVLQVIASEPRLQAIPLVVVSVPTELGWVQDQFAEVIDGVLAKPIMIDPLVEVLDSIDGLGSRFLLR